MPRSRARKPAGGGRLQVVGIVVTLLVVAVLVGSLAGGLVSGRTDDRPPAARPQQGGGPPPGTRVRVEVLNASGVPGRAAEGRRVLRDRGFDVVQIGNATGFAPDSSVVLDRVGRMELARSVADAVGITRVYARPDSNLYLDATVVLGRDWGEDSATVGEP